MADCIFCTIARGESTTRLVYENERVAAFDDIHPQAPVHVLVVPKRHYGGLEDDVPEEVLASLLAAVPTVAGIKGVARSGYRVIINTGRDGAQTVPHLHVHVLGGRQMRHGMLRFSDETEGM